MNGTAYGMPTHAEYLMSVTYIVKLFYTANNSVRVHVQYRQQGAKNLLTKGLQKD